jgi:predicted anti-sigma-YlaC factor YlaD
MNPESLKKQNKCLREEISLYLDGELSAGEELRLEKHFAECPICLEEFNLQKKMLSALNFAFDEREEIELPENFTKVVVTKAESSVKGLRSKEERFRALLLCFSLILIFTVVFGFESRQIAPVLTELGNRILAIGGFLFHLTFDISIGIAVILRTLSQKVVFSSAFNLILLVTVFIITFFTFSRIYNRFNSEKAS